MTATGQLRHTLNNLGEPDPVTLPSSKAFDSASGSGYSVADSAAVSRATAVWGTSSMQRFAAVRGATAVSGASVSTYALSTGIRGE